MQGMYEYSEKREKKMAHFEQAYIFVYSTHYKMNSEHRNELSATYD